jgi:hypothetical protein
MGPEPRSFEIISSPVGTEHVSRVLTTNEVLHDLYPDQMDRESGTYGGRRHTKFWKGNLKERD